MLFPNRSLGNILCTFVVSRSLTTPATMAVRRGNLLFLALLGSMLLITLYHNDTSQKNEGKIGACVCTCLTVPAPAVAPAQCFVCTCAPLPVK